MKQLITEEQAKSLQEISDTLNSALVNKQSMYQAKIIDENGEIDVIENREQHLENVIDWALTALGITFDFLE
ncbi:TscA family type II toxin-antitoxin system antitoxin [Solibacillus sp. FSL K6-1523]|uniref:TscA family type II toxin-antitoxin system antitoxin n=1 Tax=Solibacillus sp. FSL K6-1523 TaxID=2921471 RepID=UPI004046DBAA